MARKKGERLSGRTTGGHPFTREKLRQAASATVLEHAEQVDREEIIKRLRDGEEISATFLVGDRLVSCSVSARKYSLQELCTCEANYFCQHAAALVLAWLDDPHSFLDLERYLDDLQKRPKEELVGMVRQLVGRYPATSLEALGEDGFQPAELLDIPPDIFREELFLKSPEELTEDEFEPEEEEELARRGLSLDDFDDFDDDPGNRGNLN